MTTIVRKITIRNLGFPTLELKKLVLDDEKEGILHTIVKIFGLCHSAKPGQSDNGEFLKLSGEFTGVNLTTGELYSSSTAILPNFISDQFVSVLKEHGSVEFALEIGVERRDNTATGYVFSVKSLMPAKSSNRMLELMAANGGADVVKLAAPAAQITAVVTPITVADRSVESAPADPLAYQSESQAFEQAVESGETVMAAGAVAGPRRSRRS